jgi:hypothetical protein
LQAVSRIRKAGLMSADCGPSTDADYVRHSGATPVRI